jgi:hypothetical protein
MKKGIELIAEERQRQIEVEGYTAQHDAQHSVYDFANAAESYVESAKLLKYSKEIDHSTHWHESNEPFYWKEIKDHFPWDKKYFKPTTPLRDLIKAGALIAAAIDRLQME